MKLVMSQAFLLLGATLFLQPSLAIDDGSACRYLTNLLEDLLGHIPQTAFKRRDITQVNYMVSLTCNHDSISVTQPEWCLLLNNATCNCSVTDYFPDVTTNGLELLWNVSESNILNYDGTLLGCFDQERLVMAVYATGTETEFEPKPNLEDLTIVRIVSTVLGLVSTAVFVLPCCGLSYYMTLKRVKKRKDGKKYRPNEKEEQDVGRRTSRSQSLFGVQNPNVKTKDIQEGTRLGNGRFGEVQKAEVLGICGDSPFRNLACVKIFQEASAQNRMQRCEALRKVDFKKNLAPHVNLINFLGACSSGRKVILVVELGVFGTLHSFLEANRRAKMSSANSSYPALEDGKRDHLKVAFAKECPPLAVKEVEDVFTGPLDTTLTNDRILAIAEQIAKGLLHLSQLSIIHKRLTCESVYIGANYCIKVGGFACEKSVSHPHVRRPSAMDDNGPQLTGKTPKGRPLAWWSAPEVIESLMYSQASDVWSFGMTLWELASDGDTPMQGCGADKTSDLPDLFYGRGVRPSRPASCSDMLFNIMQDCWEAHPLDRPGLTYIGLQLSRQLHGPAPGQPSNASRPSIWRPPPLPNLIEDELEEEQ